MAKHDTNCVLNNIMDETNEEYRLPVKANWLNVILCILEFAKNFTRVKHKLKTTEKCLLIKKLPFDGAVFRDPQRQLHASGRRSYEFIIGQKRVLFCLSLFFLTLTFSSICNAMVLVTCETLDRSKSAAKCLNCAGEAWNQDILRQNYNYLLAIDPGCEVYQIELTGKLVQSDLLFVQSAINFGYDENVGFAKRPNGGPHFTMFTLNTNGGDLQTALQIGDFLYTRSVPTNVQQCYSACVFVLAGARSRSYSSRSHVGIHAPFISDVSGTKSYEDVIAELNQEYNKLEYYMQKYGVSRAIVDKMRTVPSSEILQLTVIELDAFGLGLVNTRYEDEVRFTISRNCGDDVFQQYRNGNVKQKFQIRKKCAPNLL